MKVKFKLSELQNKGFILKGNILRKAKPEERNKPTESKKKNTHHIYSKIKQGSITIGGKTFYTRSSWEITIAKYLQLLKEIGSIKDWNYEPKTFWFENIKRGVRSYKPDFEVIYKTGEIHYWEVKGWMDKKSKTKLKRMAKYYPNVFIEVITKERYYVIKNMISTIPIKQW
jgi:hypothetical protein